MLSSLRCKLALLLVFPLSYSLVVQGQSAPEKAAKASRAYYEKNYKSSVSLTEEALREGAKSATVAYNGACAAALDGDVEHAFALLDKAIKLGYHNDEMTNDSDLATLRSDPRWTKSIGLVKANAAAFRRVHSDPESVKFITSDVALFWNVYDKIGKADDPVRVLDEEYLNAGTVGLQDFVSGRISSGKNLYATIQKHPKFYGAIRENTLKTKLVEAQVRESFRKFKKIYPDALFPDVYFVIGAMNSGGTYSENGLLLGAELHGMGAGVPTDELSAWEKSVVKPYTVLPNIISHELMHFQQKHEAKTLLGKAIHEGSADFLASLVSEGNFNEVTYQYGYAHEGELWRQFKSEMLGSDTSKWLYGESQRDGHPADLGYFIGFRISQAYYNKSKDKQRAIREILTVEDFEKLLRESGYGTQFE